MDGRDLDAGVGDAILVDGEPYGCGIEWVVIESVAPGTASVYPYKATLSNGARGQWAAREIIAFRRSTEAAAAAPMMLSEQEAEDVRAYARLKPYLDGYARRLRISNGTASDQDKREVAAEDRVVARLRAAGEIPLRTVR